MSREKINTIGICGVSVTVCAIFSILQQFTALGYIGTALAKILFFGGIPLIYYTYKKIGIGDTLPSKTTFKQARPALILGLAVLGVVLGAYMTTKNFINLEHVAEQLMLKSNVTPLNFPFVALYITFGNSFLEEYFFRGFIFLTLYKAGHKKLAYLFSSLLFAVYHVAIFNTWFSPGIIVLALLGLFIGGIIFNVINTRTSSIINSWLIHIFADSAIIAIGIKMFYF